MAVPRQTVLTRGACGGACLEAVVLSILGTAGRSVAAGGSVLVDVWDAVPDELN